MVTRKGSWLNRHSPAAPSGENGSCSSRTMPLRRRQLEWTAVRQDPQRLRGAGFQTLHYPELLKKISSARCSGASRSSLLNPAREVLDLFGRHSRVAVLEVPCHPLQDLPLVYGYLVEPAFRQGCHLLIQAHLSLEELAALPAGPEPFWGYSWSRDRLLHLLEQGHIPTPVPSPPVVPGRHRWWRRLIPGGDTHPAEERLDAQQLAAVRAGDGVVQVIAPAGSGKTTVLIRRVRELQGRGTPPEGILCMSFNRDAKEEIGRRLAAADLEGVVVRSFHGMGREILRDEGRLRPELGELPDSVMEELLGRLPPLADERQLTVPEARNLVSDFKLARMMTPDEADHPLFTAYQAELERRRQLDFDDLIAASVRLLQTDPAVRRRWQGRFLRVLVDEYQDIEPAQALLVGLLAAPQDSLFCVGDEDQCIYAWRRATVQRIIELDQVYPGLERHALEHNYRCGRRITAASRRLIQHNQVRFRKPLRSGSPLPGRIDAVATADRKAGARLAAWLLSDAAPGKTALLARTDNLLAEVRLACRRARISLEGVDLGTIHAAKGREWERVILFGVDEGQAPHAAALAAGELESERRLFYVALTRAKLRLEIICTRGRESRFLREAGIRVSTG